EAETLVVAADRVEHALERDLVERQQLEHAGHGAGRGKRHGNLCVRGGTRRRRNPAPRQPPRLTDGSPAAAVVAATSPRKQNLLPSSATVIKIRGSRGV